MKFKNSGIPAILSAAICLAALLLLSPAAILRTQAQSSPAFALITGTVTYRERIALAPEAVLRVRLEAVSAPDAPPKLIAEVSLPTHGRQVPLAFAIPYKMTDIVKGNPYRIRAEILVNGVRRYESRSASPVLTSDVPVCVPLLVQSSAATPAAKATASLEETYWKLTFLEGQTPLVPADRREPHLILRKEGHRMTGTAGCNQLFGTYALMGNQLTFSGIAGTLMACPEPLMKQERVFTDALKATTAFKISAEELELLAGSKVVARFHIQPFP